MSSHHVTISLQSCWGLNRPPTEPIGACSLLLEDSRDKGALVPWETVVKPLAPPTQFSKAFPRSLRGRTACKAGVCRTLTKATCSIFNSASAYVCHGAVCSHCLVAALLTAGRWDRFNCSVTKIGSICDPSPISKAQKERSSPLDQKIMELFC